MTSPQTHRTAFCSEKRQQMEKLQTHNEIADWLDTLDYLVATVLTILKEAIEKIKISLLLPTIFENPRTLQNYMKGTPHEDCLAVVMEYREQRKHASPDPPSKLNYALIKCIDYFHENHQILHVLPNWLDDIDNDEITILVSLAKLSELARTHLQRRALPILANEKHLHEVYLANGQVEKNIKDLILEIQNRKINKMWKFAAKTGAIKALEEELEYRQQDSEACVAQAITKSNREIETLSAEFSVKQKDLEEELEKVRLKYENELKMALKEEKKIKDERNKYQLQLLALVKKYDQTILDKYREEIDLNEEYDQLKSEFDEFMNDYNREYDLYNINVRQKEEEYKRQHEFKIRSFSDNLAARRIQRWWKLRMRQERKARQALAKKQLKNGRNRKTVTGGIYPKGTDKRANIDRGSKAPAGIKDKKKL